MFSTMFGMLLISTIIIVFYEERALIEEEEHLKQKYSATANSTIAVATDEINLTLTAINSTIKSSPDDASQKSHQHLVDYSSTKIILFWTGLWGVPYWGWQKETITENDLKSVNCPVTSCILTHNRNYFDRADFLVFNVAGPGTPDIPKTRRNNQSYIMFSHESPDTIGRTFANHAGMFNLTWTYRLDSDIFTSHGFVKEKLTGEIVAPSREPKWREIDESEVYDDDIMKMIRNKNVTAAWFVSNCETSSRRDKLAKELQFHGIDVDIYGKCGTKSCAFDSAECDQLLNTMYKFYYAFENSLYVDYLTEKVFNNMKHFVVPVVFNGGEMNRFLPPKSYINAQDFKTVADLAAYLKFVGNNENEYMKYFWWKKYYSIDLQRGESICNLCSKSHQAVHKYDNVFEWINRNQSRESKILF